MPKKLVARIVPALETLIYEIRGMRVMLDSDLAKIYGVPTFRFNEAIKRNRHRFPADFMFQLTLAEFDTLKSQSGNSSQFAMSSRKHRGAAYRPYAFTEYGALMASAISGFQFVSLSAFRNPPSPPFTSAGLWPGPV